MNSCKITITFLAFFAISILYCNAQVKRYPKYSFGFSAMGGYGTLQQDLPKTAQLGLSADYQANPLSWFSLRLGVGFTGYLNTAQSVFSSGFVGDVPNQVYYEQNVQTNAKASQFYFSFAPVFYYREKKVNLFAGLAGGFGYAKLNWQRSFKSERSDIGYQESDSGSRDNYLMVGYSPFIGVSYNVRKKNRPKAEIELCINKQTWLNTWDRNPIYFAQNVIDIRAITIQLTYRVLLEK